MRADGGAALHDVYQLTKIGYVGGTTALGDTVVHG